MTTDDVPAAAGVAMKIKTRVRSGGGKPNYPLGSLYTGTSDNHNARRVAPKRVR